MNFPSDRILSDEELWNRQLVLNIYEHVLKPLDSSRVDDYIAEGYIQHNPMAETGSEGLKRFLDWAREKSPRAEHHVKSVFVDGNYVVAHVHVIIEPGDRGNAVIDVFRCEGGRVVEHWDVAQAIPAASSNLNGMF